MRRARRPRCAPGADDQIVGLDLGDITVDGQITKAPCGGEAAGRSPVDRGKLGIKWSSMTQAAGIPLGCVIAGANRHDSVLLRPTLERLRRFGLGLPHDMHIHLDAGYDSNVTRELPDELGLDGHIQPKGVAVPINHTNRWVVEPTTLGPAAALNIVSMCTERRVHVIEACLAVINAIIIVRRLAREAWTTHRWRQRPKRRPDLSARSLARHCG